MQIPPINQNFKNWAETLSWLAATVGGLVAVFKALYEVQQSRLQRAHELRWRQAQAGKQLNDEMLSDQPAKSALEMLDWDGREFEIAPAGTGPIRKSEWRSALRTSNTDFSGKEMFVRDCFDNLLYFMGIMEHHIRRGLVVFEDVAYPLEYYIGIMNLDRGIFVRYMEAYGFARSVSFLERFPKWSEAAEVARKQVRRSN
jgi:hypothetical protein